MNSPRQRFLNYVRQFGHERPVVSPFLPYADVIERSLRYLGMPVTDDPVQNEINLSRELDSRPVARQLRHSLVKYLAGDAFQPSVAVDLAAGE